MGEEFQLAGQPILEIRAVGTAPIARLDIVRNNHYVFSHQPTPAANREVIASAASWHPLASLS